MIDSFKQVSFEGFSPIAKAIGEFPSNFCDFSPFVILMWQKYYKTEYAVIDSAVVLRHFIDGEYHYSPISNDTVSTVGKLFELLNTDTILLSLVNETDAISLSESFTVINKATDEAWSDYIYLHSELSSLSGKRFAGQRNHINKFASAHPDWRYEEITKSNLSDVLEFYKELTSDTSDFDATALYEREMLIEYLESGFCKLTLSGGLIRADKKVVAFAFGEVINNMLFVHVEKAKKDVQGAYQMIVREFARHNPAEFINREEDMGIEGLRTSKRSYHPIRLEQKYKLEVRK